MNAKSCPVGDAMCIRYEDYTAEDSRIPRPTPTPPSPRHTLPPGVLALPPERSTPSVSVASSHS